MMEMSSFSFLLYLSYVDSALMLSLAALQKYNDLYKNVLIWRVRLINVDFLV